MTRPTLLITALLLALTLVACGGGNDDVRAASGGIMCRVMQYMRYMSCAKIIPRNHHFFFVVVWWRETKKQNSCRALPPRAHACSEAGVYALGTWQQGGAAAQNRRLRMTAAEAAALAGMAAGCAACCEA